MIEFVSIQQAGELDAYVARHKHGHFMQSSLWGCVKRDWPWTGIILRVTSGTIRGTIALLRHDSRLFPSCFFYAPRGPIFDDMTVFSELIDAAADYAKAQGAYMLRIDPEIPETDEGMLALANKKGFRLDQASDFSLFQPRLCYVSDLTGKDEVSLASSFQRSTRQNIHKALRGPLTVRLGTMYDLDDFMRMMKDTASKNGFQPRQEAYYRAVLEGLGSAARLYIAELEGTPVAGAISVIFGETCSFFYSCSAKGSEKTHVNELLQWHLQTDALRLGCTRFDFRGVIGYPDEQNPHLGLHNYKRGYGAKFCAYIGQLDLPIHPWLYALSARLCMSHAASLAAVSPAVSFLTTL